VLTRLRRSQHFLFQPKSQTKIQFPAAILATLIASRNFG
jgi:hypothetical protein